MKRALRVAEKARGTCSPNPFVGAVLVKNGKVIAEGWTQCYGSDHAEVQALKKAGKNARGAELYVTLEPCSHFGKTPPCTQAIIAAGVKRVYVGIEDPNPLVRGIEELREAGIEVQTGFLAQEISQQLEYHLCRVKQQRPFVIWKAALSLDGKYAAQDLSSRWISNAKARLFTHHLREEADVVLTGIGTVLSDDPQLNVRLPQPKKQPLRAILDPKLLIPPDARILQAQDTTPTCIFCARGKENTAKAKQLSSLGIQLYPVTTAADKLNLREVLGILHNLGHYCVLLECGSKLASSFFAAKLVDKCFIFYGAKILGGDKAILKELPIPNISAAIELKDLSFKVIQDNFLITGYPVFP